MNNQFQDAQHWTRLSEIAADTLANALAALPQDVRTKLAELPITFETKPNIDMVASGIDADRTLGLFTGGPYSLAIAVSQRLPPQIILFLENIFAYVRGDLPEFRAQVRRTLLHEIGHYLGLDEHEVRVRDL